MRSRICTILCLLTMLGFVTLFVQEQWKPFKMKPLQGFTPVVEKPKLSMGSFASGDYQSDVEDYISDNFGFREFFIRAYNQFSYSCFREVNNDNIEEGKDRELFLKMYLDDITGKRLLQFYPDEETAKAEARKNVEATSVLVDSLRKHHTEFLFVFAPSKTALYPELMPKAYRNRVSDFSLEEYYIQLFEEKGLPYVDFLSYFRSLKGEFPYPLYTRTGTHWSEATIPMVADSLFRKLEEITGFSLPSINYVDPNLTTEYSVQDGELEASMNLLFPLRKPAVPRPVFTLTDTIGKDRPNLLVVGDSYFSQLCVSCFTDAFSHWDYWKYNRDISSSRKGFSGKEVKWLPEASQILEEADIVMAVFTAPCLCDYMYNFAETGVELYTQGALSAEQILNLTIERIRSDKKWMALIERQAQEKGLTVEENLVRNAKYVIEQEKKKKKQ